MPLLPKSPHRNAPLPDRIAMSPGTLACALLAVLAMLAIITAGGCGDDDPERARRLQDLARWEDRRLAPADSLAQALTSRDPFVRLAAARAAGLIRRDDVVPALETLLGDRSQAVRAEAAWSLGLIGDARALPALSRASADRQPPLRVAALAALAHVPSDGAALLAGTRLTAPKEAALAWDSLRPHAARAHRDSLRVAITAGLARPESDVRWRVLRCAELAPDSTLSTTLATFARAPQVQERVHAYRALGKQRGVAALAAVLGGFDSHSRFRGRDRDRVAIAGCRALGALAAPLAARASEADHEFLAQVADRLIAAAAANSAGVAEIALESMSALVARAPLPPEAATLESLLPVWRLRLVKAASERASDTRVGVRAAAATAWADLRGPTAGGGLERALGAETVPHVAAAQLRALARIHPAPAPLLASRSAGPLAAHALVRMAALEGLAHVAHERPQLLPPDLGPGRVAAIIAAATSDTSFAVAATAAGLAGGMPGDGSAAALLRTWATAGGAGTADVRSGVLEGLGQLFAAPPATVATGTDGATGAAGISLPASPAPPRWEPSPALGERVRQVLLAAFAEPDLRVRLAAREAALATGLLTVALIPTEASLRATLPAALRHPAQPPLAQPSRVPDLRCDTTRGSFRIRLHADTAPNTCALFLWLAGRGWFDGQAFHRVVPDFVAQGGDPDGTGWGGPGFAIRSEANRRPYRRGAVGVADSGLDTGGSQFFVTLSEQPHLNGRYTLFGEVVEGMDVVDRLQVGDTYRFSIVP
ncbi:MAG: peptidylprolyl isomerase [bacterium]|nr:peptidylprolyl isomerase [bacterium]